MTTALPAAPFGAGGSEPWSAVLEGAPEDLLLFEEGGTPTTLDAARWFAPADDVDRGALDGLLGPVLDVGCGPGRMVAAALEAGLGALGIDTAGAAVRRCAGLGLPVLHRSVFDPLPREGRWGAVLLLDGNIGIGGDVAGLLARARALLAPGGLLVAEVHPDPAVDVAATTMRVLGGAGASGPFPWSRAGAPALLRAARGFDVASAWTAAGRAFVRLRRT